MKSPALRPRLTRWPAPTLTQLEPREVPAFVTVFQDGLHGYTGTQDVELRQALPATNRNGSGTVLVRANDGSGNASQGLLRFDNLFGTGPEQIPPNALIRDAYVTLTTTDAGDGGRFFRMTADWSETTATWNSLTDGLDAGTDTVPEREGNAGNNDFNDVVEVGGRNVNVLDSVRAWQAGAANRGWAVLPWVGSPDGWQFTPSEGATRAERPKLTVVWDVIDTSTPVQQVRFQDGVNGYTGTVDTALVGDNPAASHATATTVFSDALNPGDGTGPSHVLMRFSSLFGTNPGQIPPGSTIVSASLELSGTTSNTQGDGGQFFRLLQPFNSADTWAGSFGGNGVQNNGVEATATANTVAGNANLDADLLSNRNVLDVTPDIQAWADGTTNYGWAVVPWPDGMDGWGFHTSDAVNVGDRPGLVVAYIPPGNTVTANPIPRLVVDEDATAATVNLADYFTSANPIAYTVTQTNTTGLVTPVVNGASLQLAFAPNGYGYSYFRVTANDGVSSRTVGFEVLVNPVDDLANDTLNVTSAAATALNVLANDAAPDRVPLAEAANLRVVQNDTGNNPTSVTATVPQGTPGVQLFGANRGDYNVQIGASTADDLTGGILLSTVRQNGRDNGEAGGVEYATSSMDFFSGGLFVALHSSPAGDEYNVNAAVAYFPFSQGWLGAFARNPEGTNGGANGRLESATPNGGLDLTANIQDQGSGRTRVSIDGVNSQTDGILLVVHAKNEANYALARANADGSWQVFVRDNGSVAAGFEQDPIAFVYVPRGAANVVSGRILGNGAVHLPGGNFSVFKTGTGTYELSIPGQTPMTGALILSAEGGNGTNANNIVSYQASGDNFVIQTRDIGSTTADPTLEDVGGAVPVASFAFIPFLTAAPRVTSVQSTTNAPGVSDLGATLTVNADGTVQYNPASSAAIQALAPGTTTADTFTYTTTNLNGKTTTATATVNVTAPALQVASVLVNGTTAPAANVTTSRVLSLRVSFNAVVSAVDPGAFTLTRGATTLTSGGGGAVSVTGFGTKNLTLTFTGTGGVEFGSLADGIWTLTTDLSRVRDVATAAGTGTSVTNNVRRLFGDGSGEGTVNLTDFGLFGATFGKGSAAAGFNLAFDFDGNGVINLTDFGAFGQRFGKGL